MFGYVCCFCLPISWAEILSYKNINVVLKDLNCVFSYIHNSDPNSPPVNLQKIQEIWLAPSLAIFTMRFQALQNMVIPILQRCDKFI